MSYLLYLYNVCMCVEKKELIYNFLYYIFQRIQVPFNYILKVLTFFMVREF